MTIRPTTISRRRKNVRDSSGHEHASDTGQFTSGGGGASAKPENKLPTSNKGGNTGVTDSTPLSHDLNPPGWPKETNLGSLKELAKQKLGKQFGGVVIRHYGGGGQVEVLRIKHGYHGTEKVRAAVYPLPKDPVEKSSESPKGTPVSSEDARGYYSDFVAGELLRRFPGKEGGEAWDRGHALQEEYKGKILRAKTQEELHTLRREFVAKLDAIKLPADQKNATRRRKAAADSAFLDLPDVRQIHDYDCGAASVRSVAVYFGVDDGRTEEDFIRELDTTPTSIIENGTAWQAIVNWFRRAGLEATPQQNMTLDDLKAHWRAGRPVIVALQDYGSLADYAKNESGHYVTVCGFVGDDVIVQDPSADNAEAGGRLPDHFPDSIQDFGKLMVRSDTFMSVWHDVDASGDVLTRFGICVGRPPASGRKNVKDREGHEHASDTGQFTSGGGGGASAAKPDNKLPASSGESADAGSGPPKDDPVHSYLGAFDADATAADANTANSEIEDEGSDYRVVPDGQGGWKAAHVDDLDDQFGDNWTITNDPLTGKVDIGPDDYFYERRKLRGDKISASYVEAFNAPGEKPTDEELAQANAEMAADGSKYQLAYSEDDGAYIAVRRRGKKPAKSLHPWSKAAKPANRLPV